MILHKQKIIYLHPTKTAGCAIEQALFERELQLCGVAPPNEQVGIYTKPRLRTDLCYMYGVADWVGNQHWGLEEIHDAYPFTRGWRVVLSVRDPYDRAVSEFKYQCGGHGHHNHQWGPSDFEDAVISGELFRNSYASHNRPQSSYIPNDAHYDLLRFEHLQDDFSSLFPGARLQVANQSNPMCGRVK